VLFRSWRVESASTKQLVVGVFEALAAKPPPPRAEALRRSMLAVMASGGRDGGVAYSHAHPFFWAPYALVGDGGR
jgi:CHAT domain-containing protein